MPLFRISQSQAIKSLREMSSFGLGPQPSQKQMAKLIEKMESQYPQIESYELAFWLGIALRNYTAWFIRGDERKQFLERAVQHLERAYNPAKGRVPESQLNGIASELGALLVDEAVIRDLDRGIAYLERVFNTTQDYVPLLCSYADALYELGDYGQSAKVATELHRRAKKSPEWKDSVPPAPRRIAAKAYRAQAKRLKKEGRTKQAIAVFKKLVRTGFATENDQHFLAKLEAAVK